MDLNNVRMLQPRDGFCLIPKASQQFWWACCTARQTLMNNVNHCATGTIAVRDPMLGLPPTGNGAPLVPVETLS